MPAKFTAAQRIQLVKRAIKGEEVAKICKESGISRVLFYRWLKKYKEAGETGLAPGKSGRPQVKINLPKKLNYTKLSPQARLSMVKEVTEQDRKLADVAKRYGVSRVTIYKWIKRYKSQIASRVPADLRSKVPVIGHYYRETPGKHQEAVLALVAKHPEYGIRSLVSNLPKVGLTPIVGHHGVQNILKKRGLLHYTDRLVYAKAQITPITVIIGKALEPVFAFFRIESGLRRKIVRSWSTIAFGIFSLIIIFGLSGFLAQNVFSITGVSKIGLSFASIALFMGSIFFLYSFKYYLTLAIVLSYSQDSSGPGRGKTFGNNGLLSRILGFSGSGNSIKGQISAGLEPDLSHIKLSGHPYVSVQIPFYNEKNVVRRSIEAAINFNYPEYEIILCDDSTDQTTDIISAYMKDYLGKGEKLQEVRDDAAGWVMTFIDVKPGVTLKHLHRTTRDGYKGKALELALKLCDGRTEKIAVFDADFVPYPDSLTMFLKYFQIDNNPKTAAVQGYQWHVLNKSENWITRGVRSEYSGSYVIERSGVEVYGGLKQISGSVYMIKKEILDKIGWGTSITEDLELTLNIYKAGYKVLYTPYIQSPAECASTLRRLVRQRMRWAEGHSFNVKRSFWPLMKSPNLTITEKMEFMYLTPYYLQAFFFLIGTLAWLVSESVFRVRLPFWTETWGWSLVITNMISLPLVNAVGLFLEESDERDYLGLISFLALTYMIVPFQAYAAVKGFIEEKEGPWFRTPKTGRITDIFNRHMFYKWFSKSFGVQPVNPVQKEDIAPDIRRPNFILGSDTEVPMGEKSWKRRLVTTLSLIFVIGVTSALSFYGQNAWRTKMPSINFDWLNYTKIFLTISGVIGLFTILRMAKKVKIKKMAFIFARYTVVSMLIISWLLTSFPAIPLINFPPKIKEARAAFSAVTARGSATEQTSDTTLAVSPSANLTVGKLVIVSAVTDNAATTDGPSTLHTITDSQSNVWTKVFEETETDGAANDGSTSSLWWTRVGTQIGTGDSITLTTASARTAKIIEVFETTIDSNSTIGTSTQNTHSVSGSNTSISQSLSSLTNREYLFVGFAGSEGNDASKGAIANYTERFDLRTGTTAGTAVDSHVGTRILTGTGDTWTSSAFTYTSAVQSLTAFYEIPITAALGGTAAATINETDVVTGGKTITLTLTNDTWVASGATFDAERQNIINGLDSAQAEATGWDAVVKAGLATSTVVRTSDTVVTVTLSAFATYDITAQETITATIPSTALTLGIGITASPTFTVDTTGSHTPKQGSWRFYTDATPDGSMSALAGENAIPTLTGAQMQNTIIRLRAQIDETGGVGGSGTVALNYSEDGGTTWVTVVQQTPTSSDTAHWFRFANGAATAGNTIGTTVLTGTTESGKYIEETGTTESVGASKIHEADFALKVHWPPPDSNIKFQLVYAGTALALDTGASYPELQTSSAANRGSVTITRLDADGSQKTSREMRFASWPRFFYDGTRWWFFTVFVSSPTIIRSFSWEGSGGWTARATVDMGANSHQSLHSFAFKVISGVPTVIVHAGNSSTSRKVVKGTISGTTITWGTVQTVTQNSDRHRNVAFDDGNFVWIGGTTAATGVWVRRSTSANDVTAWNSALTASDTGVASGDVFTLVGLASDKALAIWRSGSVLKYATVTSSGFGTVTTLNSTTNAGPEDWGVTRSNGYVYVVHSDSTATGGNWKMRVFDESNDTWSSASDPGVSGQPSNNDGIAVTADGNDIYAVGTFADAEGGQDRKLGYVKYTGPGAGGSWGSLTDISSSAGSRGNGDHVDTGNIQGGGLLIFGWNFNDDDSVTLARTAEFHTITVPEHLWLLYGFSPFIPLFVKYRKSKKKRCQKIL